MPKRGLPLTQKKLRLPTKARVTRIALTASYQFRTPERGGLLQNDAPSAWKSFNNNVVTIRKFGTGIRASIAALSFLAARNASDVAPRRAALRGAKLTTGIGTINPDASHAQILLAKTCARKKRSIAQESATTATCVAQSVTVKTQHAARKSTANPEGLVALLAGKTA